MENSNKINKKNKSITVIAGNYPAPNHMALVFVQQLVHAMIHQGVKITVIAPQSITHSIIHMQKLLPKYSIGKTENGVEYDIYRPVILSCGKIKFFRNIFGKFFNWYNNHVITSRLNKVNNDLIYSHFWSSALPIYDYAYRKRIPLFVACGEGDDALENMIVSLPKDNIKSLSNAVKGVISVSSENKRKCIEFGLVKEEDIQVFPNCVNIAAFHKMNVDDLKKELGIKEDDFVISFVGGFIPRKGPDRIAKAISNLNDCRIKVMFIGKPFPGYLYDFDCPGIIHKGPLDHDLLPKYINCADVFVLPTQKEGCCNAIVEALAIGIPIISSDEPFNDDILNEFNSIRIKYNDIDAISSAIMKLKNDKVLRKQMSEYSLSRHEEYSIDSRAIKILKFIDKQIEKI